MAWPCITRACCINRFWSELDKADIAVPLVFTKYSDVAEVRHLHPQPGLLAQSRHPVAIETESAHTAPQESAAASASSAAREGSVTRQDFKPWKVKPEPSCKPKSEYRPCQTPFNNETQYQKDYKPWPVQKRGDHPWIPKVENKSVKQDHVTTEPDTGVEKCEIEERVKEKEGAKEENKERPLKKDQDAETGEKKKEQKAGSRGRSAADAVNRQIKQEGTGGSSYRTSPLKIYICNFISFISAQPCMFFCKCLVCRICRRVSPNSTTALAKNPLCHSCTSGVPLSATIAHHLTVTFLTPTLIFFRMEFKAYTDVKPVKAIKAKSQYKMSIAEKANLETSYNATYKGEQGKPEATDNKLLDRRRIRSLYNEPSIKEP
ncbi:microtubule-associated protein 6-like, partial [Silurus meridionalis]